MPTSSDILGYESDEDICPLSGGETQLCPPNLPWDVFSHICKCVDDDWSTLKSISLVCRDFLTESAPKLCRFIKISVRRSAVWGTGLPALQAQTKALKNHTRRKYIKDMKLRLCPDRGAVLAHSTLKDRFAELFSAIQLLEGLQTFEMVSDLQPELTYALRSTELPITLSELHMHSHKFTPFDKLFKDSFWRRHAPHLTTLTLMAPLMIDDRLGGYPTPFPLLTQLHVSRHRVLANLNVQENTLKYLRIGEISDDDVPSLHAKLTTLMPALAALKRFDFRYSGYDPSGIYTNVIAHMSQLQWLVVTHGRFPRQTRLSEALLKLEHLQLFEWITPDLEQSDHRHEDEEQHWMAFANSVTECRPLFFLTYRSLSSSGTSLTNITLARRGHGHPWRRQTEFQGILIESHGKHHRLPELLRAG